MKNDILEIIQQHKLGHIPDEQAINELCVLFSVVGQSEQLHTEVFNLANKLAINGYGNEAVKMHVICNGM